MAFLAERAFELLNASYESDRLAHAYLMTGPAGSGKEALALRVVNLVAGSSWSSLREAEGEHVRVVAPESKSRRIRVQTMREVERSLHLSAPRGVVKIAVVLDADRLMPEAANAFLKTLEEPPPQSLILLLTSQPGQLLDTTRSRCIQVPLYRTGTLELGEAEERLLDELSRRFDDDSQKGLPFAWSLLQSFGAILKDEKAKLTKDHGAALKEEEAVYRQTTEGDWLKQREEYYKGLTEAHYLERRDDLVQVLVAWYGDALRASSGLVRKDLPGYTTETARLGERLGSEALLRRLSALEELRKNLQTNVHEGLALEAAFLEAFGTA